MKMRTTPKPVESIQPLRLDGLRKNAKWFPEPQLCFGDGRTCTDPKVGIPLYGPRSLKTTRHKREIHVGFIGTGEAVDHAIAFLTKCSEGIDGDDDHSPFPGFRADRGFQSDLKFNDQIVEKITQHERQELLGVTNGRDRFERTLGLLNAKMDVLTRRDHPLDFVFLVLPQDLYLKCRTANYRVKGVDINRNLRRAFKAMAMTYLKPTQILLETTTGLAETNRKLDHQSIIAWNLFCGMYFKIEGLPWGPVGLPPSSCHVGISFYRPHGESSTMRASVVQAFDENGDGLVLRGPEFHWDERKDGRSPHLSEEMAGELMKQVLWRYQQERNHLPARVVVHKVSEYDEAEQTGFQAALAKVKQFDLLAVHPVSSTRLIRAGTRPALRGTSFQIGDQHFLYTTGYIPELGRYPHGHVPSPLLITDHVGDTHTDRLQQEILTLTKMNWNSANMHGLWPITLRFSRLVSDVLREVPQGQDPNPKYKYYM
jgi:hypothetical protein